MLGPVTSWPPGSLSERGPEGALERQSLRRPDRKARTDVEESAGSSELGVTEGSCAARADAGVDGSSVAGTGGEGDEGSSPGSDDELTPTSVASGEIGSRDAET